MYSREELERVNRKQKNAEIEVSKMEGKLESVMNNIKEDGFDTLKEYKEEMSRMEEELKTIGDELDELEETIKIKFPFISEV